MNEQSNFDKYIGTIKASSGISPQTIVALGLVIVGAMWVGEAGKQAIRNSFRA